MSELSYLEKLLDGVEVEWLSLSEISEKISSGGTPKTGTSEFYNGDIPWLRTQEVDFCDIWDTGVKITELGLKNSSAKWIPANCIIIAMYGATVGKIGINKISMTTNQACANISLNSNLVNYKYLFHFLSSQYEYIKSLGSGSQTNINANIVKKLLTPIPCPKNPEKSLEIQSEIVRILDKFTALTAELTAELTARKKQYNYYRDQLLSFEEENRGSYLEKLLYGAEVEWIRLGNVARIKNGKDHKLLGEGEFPVYGSGGIMRYADTYAYDKPSVLIPRKGSLGNLFFVDVPFWTVDTIFYTIIDEAKIQPKYFYYFLTTVGLGSMNQAGGVPSQTQSVLNEIKIPIPCANNPEKSLKIQSEIVRILDKFDTLTNSISEGLPREIELRQKQYEYYRDLLFNFPKPESKVAI